MFRRVFVAITIFICLPIHVLWAGDIDIFSGPGFVVEGFDISDSPSRSFSNPSTPNVSVSFLAGYFVDDIQFTRMENQTLCVIEKNLWDDGIDLFDPHLYFHYNREKTETDRAIGSLRIGLAAQVWKGEILPGTVCRVSFNTDIGSIFHEDGNNRIWSNELLGYLNLEMRF